MIARLGIVVLLALLSGVSFAMPQHIGLMRREASEISRDPNKENTIKSCKREKSYDLMRDVGGKGSFCNEHIVAPQCQDCLKPVFDANPITPDMRQRASYSGITARLRDVMVKTANRANKVLIDVIGGSFTEGKSEDVISTNNDFQGTRPLGEEKKWTSQLQKMVGSWGNIEVRNRAIGGCDTSCWLKQESYWSLVQYDVPDLILVEMAVNDQDFGSARPEQDLQPQFESLLSRLWHLPGAPAVLFVEAFRTASRSASDMQAHCPGGRTTTEQGHLEHSAYFWCSHWWEVASVHQRVLRRYEIPYFSYRDLVWPTYASPPVDLPRFWNGLSHPDWVAHYLFAEGVATMLSEVNSQCNVEQRGETPPPPIPEYAGACTAHNTVYSAANGLALFPRLAENSNVATVWQFREDVPGKPGWIAEANDTHTHR